MKQIIAITICSLMLFSLCACKDGQGPGISAVDNTNEDVAFSELDYQKNACNTGHWLRMFQFSPNGAYLDGAYGTTLYFDGESRQTVVLCAKPECTHMTLNCNAMLGTDRQYYNGNLYYLEPNEGGFSTLYRASVTGDERTEIMQICSISDYPQGYDRFLIHRDAVLFVSDYGSVKVATLGNSLESAVTLFEVTEEDKDAFEERMGTNANPFNWKLWADGDYLYFMGVSGFAKVIALYDTTYANCLFQYDMMTGECEQVWSLPDTELVGDWENAGISVDGWYVEDGVMQFHLSGNGFWATDLLTGETQQVAAVEDDPNRLGHAFYSGSAIYVSNYANGSSFSPERSKVSEYGIYIYDTAGTDTGVMLSTQELVDQYNWSSIDICAVNNGCIFIWGSGGINSGCYYFDLTDIENGQWTRVSLWG